MIICLLVDVDSERLYKTVEIVSLKPGVTVVAVVAVAVAEGSLLADGIASQ